MNSKSSARRWELKSIFAKREIIRINAFLVVLMLIAEVMPVGAASPNNPNRGPELQTPSTLTFNSIADAQVEERNPDTNAGTSSELNVSGANNRSLDSYLRFSVNGVSGVIQDARLRVFSTNDGTRNGPAAYATDNSWSETGITWNNRPARTGGGLDNKGSISTNTWVEYNVTSLVTGNGTFNFVLGGDSNDNVAFSSREGSNPPQLVITFVTTNTPTAAPTQTRTATQPPASTPTRTPTAVNTQAATSTASGGGTFTFLAVADSYVESSNPGTNYGNVDQIRVDGSPDVRSYLRFNVQGLSGAITSATLRVYANSSQSPGYDARSVNDNNWVETTITYNNAPPVGNVLGSSGNVNSNNWTSVNVTSYITGNGTYNLGLTTTGSTAISLASRESGANTPQLVIQAQGGTAPTATRTPTSIGNSTQTPTRTPTFANTPAQTATRTRTPTPGATATSSSGDAVLVGAGDISTCSNNNDEATAKLLDGISGTVFNAGDNAYNSGSITEYTNCYDPTWGRHKSRTKPSPGNHEYGTSGAAGYFQYFNNVAPYYAYNLGNWRIYSLNSEIDVSSGGAQATWLQSDLASNPKACVLAYWHKPRWSSGSTHGSTSGMQAIWQILYNAGAEVVVNGHEHNYERFAQMNASGTAVSQGLREFVVGTGGVGHYGFGGALASSEVRDSTSFGVLKLTLHANSYDWQFVPVAGSTFTDTGSANCH
jgi:calcineurin-like phosphoesterase family protein